MARLGYISRHGVWIAASVLWVLACGKGNQYANAGATSGATTRTARSDTSRVSPAAGEVAPAGYVSGMNDAIVVAALDNVDKMEVEIGRLMQTKATIDSVSTRSSEMHAIRQLRSMPRGRSLDSAFVRAMVVGHEHALANAKAMQDHVKNAQLKAFIEQTVPSLQEHLNIAQRLTQQLEKPSNSSG